MESGDCGLNGFITRVRTEADRYAEKKNLRKFNATLNAVEILDLKICSKLRVKLVSYTPHLLSLKADGMSTLMNPYSTV